MLGPYQAFPYIPRVGGIVGSLSSARPARRADFCSPRSNGCSQHSRYRGQVGDLSCDARQGPIPVSLSARCSMGMTGKISRFLMVAGVVLGLAPAVAYAQGTTISGQVTGLGGAPIVGASVSIPTLRVGAFTDDAGRYSFTAPASATGTSVTLLA